MASAPLRRLLPIARFVRDSFSHKAGEWTLLYLSLLAEVTAPDIRSNVFVQGIYEPVLETVFLNKGQYSRYEIRE